MRCLDWEVHQCPLDLPSSLALALALFFSFSFLSCSLLLSLARLPFSHLLALVGALPLVVRGDALGRAGVRGADHAVELVVGLVLVAPIEHCRVQLMKRASG
jgi:hypothetical protein